MKKFYALALSAIIALSAVAAPHAQFSRQLATAQPQVATLQHPVNISSADSQFNSGSFRAQRLQKIATPYQAEISTKVAPTNRNEVCGQYTWEFYDLFNNGDYYDYITISADPEVENGVIIDLLGVPIKATVDMSIKSVENVGDVAGVLTIPNQYTFTDRQGNEAWFIYQKWADETYSAIDTPDTPLQCFIGDGYVDFYLFDIITFQVADGSGYYFAASENVFFAGWKEYEEETWTALGYTDFYDCWVMPAFEINPADYVYEVAVEQSNTTPTRYRLVDPYNIDLFADANTGDGHGYIVFDVADPECVIFDFVSSGLTINEIGTFYCFNFAGYCAQMGLDAASIKNMIEQAKADPTDTSGIGDILLTTYEDGAVTVTDGMFYVDVMNQVYLANLYNSTIRIPGEGGINDITVDSDSDCPVEYFNLQGIRVNEPQPGAVYIRRQGRTATKVIR
ncbi:MAG: hypothetical protein ACI4AM_06410 [Muribaculaceae bacterium]